MYRPVLNTENGVGGLCSAGLPVATGSSYGTASIQPHVGNKNTSITFSLGKSRGPDHGTIKAQAISSKTNHPPHSRKRKKSKSKELPLPALKKPKK